MYATKTLTKTFNISSDTLRYYEKLGLFKPAVRQDNGYRLYDETTPKRLQFIQQCQAVGFTLREIQTLLDIDENPESDCEEVATFIEDKRQRIHAQIKHLHKIEDILAQLVASCRGDSAPTEHCPIINTFYNGDIAAPCKETGQ
jgi:MerR family transcriptional regulator, Zn(II)-responsive regulator of zntA